MTTQTHTSRLSILGIPVQMVTMEQALTLAMDMILGEKQPWEPCRLIATPNSEIIVNAEKNQKLSQVLHQADLIIPDGIGIVYASKILGQPLSERVTGFDLMSGIIAKLAGTGKSVFLLGSKPGTDETPGIAQLAAEKMQEAYPDLVIAGTHHGFFNESQESEVLDAINRSGADFLCVAMGSPRQELFIYRNRDRLHPKAAIGVGGSLDVWAGALERAPEFFQNNGLEWLYRLIQEPSRYKRMMALPLFMLKVIASRFAGQKSKGGHS